MRQVVIVLFLVVYCSSVICAPTVSIIGAGIGGGSCAYYLQNLSNGAYSEQVHAFEANDYVGGRINEIMFGGQLLEIGADAWSPVNHYIQSLQQELGIELGSEFYSGNDEIGIWNGNSFAAYKRLVIQNPAVDICLSAEIQEFISSLNNNYAEREEAEPFTTVNEFLSYGNMTNYSLEQFDNFLMQQCNASQEYMDTLVAPIVRAIYDQPMNVTSFAGEVSLLAIFTPAIWAAKGNSQLPKSLFIESNSLVHLNTHVDTVSWDGSSFTLTFNGTSKFSSDYVVLASPIEKTDISFENVTFAQQITNRTFVHCYVTHVQAQRMNAEYFGLEAGSEVPDSVLTTPDSDLPFTIVSISAESLTVPGAKIYKIFSNVDVTGVLNDIFVDMTDSHVHYWKYTFPHLIETSNFQPIELATNLIYLNTMESTVTAMEGSVIAGRNAAQLLLKQFGL